MDISTNDMLGVEDNEGKIEKEEKLMNTNNEQTETHLKNKIISC